MRERIIQQLLPLAEQHTIFRVQAGLIYSAVQLDSGSIGVAYTFPDSRDCRAGDAGGRRHLAGSKASVALSGLGGKDLLASTLGLATANALLASSPPSPGLCEEDVLESLQLRDEDRVCLVGCCREVAVLGPSTPLLPAAFLGTPVSCLAGIRVREPEGVLQCIAEGHGFRVFKKYVRKVSIHTATRS